MKKTNIITPHEKDSERSGIVIIYHPTGSIDVVTLDVSRYQALLGALRYAEESLSDAIQSERSKPGGLSINKLRIERLQEERDAVIDVLCSLDI